MAWRKYALIVFAVALAACVDLAGEAFGFGVIATYLLGIPFLAVLVLVGLPWADDRRRNFSRSAGAHRP
jgi:hypothetical protein